MTGSLIFLIIKTKVDITFTILTTSHFIKNLSHQYTKAIKIILRYIKGLKKQNITYKGQDKLFIEG